MSKNATSIALTSVRAAREARKIQDARSASSAVSRAENAVRRAEAAAANARAAAKAACVYAETPAPAKASVPSGYRVVKDGQLLATFVNADDALLFEGELAEIDKARGVTSARCEVTDARGRRVGGYLITAGRMLAMVGDSTLAARLTRGGIGGPRRL